MVRSTLLFLTALIYPVAQLLRTLRVTRNRDPWRRIVGLGLRSKGTKFEHLRKALGLEGLRDAETKYSLSKRTSWRARQIWLVNFGLPMLRA
jgi:hypothetical protein